MNDCRYSANWHYTMILQGDGNLVLYQDGATPIWASNTAGQPAAIAILQWEGNFVMYGAHGVPLWASNSGGQPPGSKLTVAGDFIENVRAASFNWQSNVSNAPHFNTKGPQPTCKNVNAGRISIHRSRSKTGTSVTAYDDGEGTKGAPPDESTLRIVGFSDKRFFAVNWP